MKICGFCSRPKEEMQFAKDVSRKDGLRCRCRQCESYIRKGWPRPRYPTREADLVRADLAGQLDSIVLKWKRILGEDNGD